MADHILEMSGITKRFPGVTALNEVTFQVTRGQCHGLVGENGAGKSTLMKVLSGFYPTGSYDGRILVGGQEQHFRGIRDSERAGIAIIFQELALAPNLSIAENLFLGNEIARFGVIDRALAHEKTREILRNVGLDLDPETLVGGLGIGVRQLIEIAKALSKKADLLILDEPTAALTETESDNLLAILDRLRSQGVTCIYISHKLNEIFRITNTVTILRDGQTIATVPTRELDEQKVIAHMVGRKMGEMYPYRHRSPGEVVLELKDWSVADPEVSGRLRLNQVEFQLFRNEILGISGLMGVGRTELAKSLIGAYGKVTAGELLLEGIPRRFESPREAILAGLNYLPEDRKGSGLNLIMDLKENMTLASLDRVSTFGLLRKQEEIVASESYVKKLGIKTPSIEQKTGNLSGGNQQKVALAKWMLCSPKVLILDEPTRGIDVGAKFEIYNLMNELVEAGMSVIMISSELPEILGVCNRILVMNEGRVAAEFSHENASQEKIMAAACTTAHGAKQK